MGGPGAALSEAPASPAAGEDTRGSRGHPAAGLGAVAVAVGWSRCSIFTASEPRAGGRKKLGVKTSGKGKPLGGGRAGSGDRWRRGGLGPRVVTRWRARR